MPDDIENEIFNLMEGREPTQNLEQSLEQQLASMVLDPSQVTIKRVRFVEDYESDVVSETREGVIINQAGFPETIQEELINICALGDGTVLNSYGICRCMNCHQLASIENISRCLCGKVVCVMCGKFHAKKSIWYCSRWHKFLGSFLSIFGFGFR